MLIWHFINLVVVNAFILYKDRLVDGGQSLTLKEFRLAVAAGLIGADPQTPQRGRRSTEPVVNRHKVHSTDLEKPRPSGQTCIICLSSCI
jgi:hypothetical protein